MAVSVDEAQRAAQAGSGAMFDGIAERYDLLNRLISFGIDQGWRAQAVSALQVPGAPTPRRVLDLATGTGDLALQIAERYPQCEVMGVDPSLKMLEVARRKVAARALASRLQLQVGDAQALAYPDASFDAVSIAFGIRNVPDRPQALREMRRVTQPGGRVVILELSEPQGGVLSALARWHMHSVVPWVGGLLSGQREYRYLPNSIRAFPPAAEFAALLSTAGFTNVQAQALSFGVCHLYVAEVP